MYKLLDLLIARSVNISDCVIFLLMALFHKIMSVFINLQSHVKPSSVIARFPNECTVLPLLTANYHYIFLKHIFKKKY